GYAAWGAGGRSLPYRNPDAIENLLCLEGELLVRLGPDLAHEIRLGRFDMLSIPVDVLHEIACGAGGAKALMVLNGAPDCAYPAVFCGQAPAGLEAEAIEALNARFDPGVGREVDGKAL